LMEGNNANTHVWNISWSSETKPSDSIILKLHCW
jgi:hypothetical protein